MVFTTGVGEGGQNKLRRAGCQMLDASTEVALLAGGLTQSAWKVIKWSLFFGDGAVLFPVMTCAPR